MDLIDAILKGVDLHSFFYSKYYGPIKYRPLNNLEVRDIISCSMEGASDEAKDLMRELRFKLAPKGEYSKDALEECSTLFHKVNLWICYYGTKDFQGDRWCQCDPGGIPFGIHVMSSPESYLEVADLASSIMKISVYGKDKMASVLKDDNGKVLAKAYWNLNYPLTDKMWKLTNLQMTFILESYNIGHLKEDEFNSIDDLMKSINMTPLRPTSKEDADMVKRWEEVKENVFGRNKRDAESIQP